MCVLWELNPQPFALITQCSTTEPQEHYFTIIILLLHYITIFNLNKKIIIWFIDCNCVFFYVTKKLLKLF